MTELTAGALPSPPLDTMAYYQQRVGLLLMLLAFWYIAEDAIAARRLASPINHVARGKPPILILASETDVSAPLPNAERMCKRMSETGQEFEFENWPEEVGTNLSQTSPVRTKLISLLAVELNRGICRSQTASSNGH